MKRPNPGARCSIPQSWVELLIRLGSQWIICSGRSSDFWLKSRRNWPPHAGHSSDPLAELCRFWLWVHDNRLWCVRVSCNNCRFGCPGTCSGFVDLSAVGKNFFLGCSVARSNLVLHRLRLPSLLQKTSSELLRLGLRSWLRSTIQQLWKHYTRLWRKFPMKGGDYSWATLLSIHPRFSFPEPRPWSLKFWPMAQAVQPCQLPTASTNVDENIIFGLPKFSGWNGQVCEAC